MSGTLFISSAYLPPVEYFSLILDADTIRVEREENYQKQTYRNRCCVLSPDGIQTLIVPVYLGSFHKTPLKEIRIDYSKRWQQVHARAITASYGSSPFFEFYFEDFERIILEKHELLIDLNSRLTDAAMKIIGIEKSLGFTSSFMPPGKMKNDYRYTLSPKKKPVLTARAYRQVFNYNNKFTGGLSIIDLIFNMGPEAVNYL
jgi:WbqC-like protein family